MNKEEAIIYCDEYLARHISDIDKDFLKKAKEALQQEPCSNCCNGNQIEKAKLCQKSYLAGMEHKQELCDKCVYSTSEGCQYDDITEAIPPFDDCISRQAVNILVDELARAISDERCCMPRGRSTGAIMQDILDLPPVTPQPKIGHWIYDKNIENWRCSECGETPKTLGYCGTADFMAEHFKYCNHCGAKMVEPQEGSDKE